MESKLTMFNVDVKNEILSYYIDGEAEIVDKLGKYKYRGIINNIIILNELLVIHFKILIKITGNKWVQMFEPSDLRYEVATEDMDFSTFIGSNLFVDTGNVSDEMIELHLEGHSPFKWDGFKIPDKIDPKEWVYANMDAPLLEISHQELERYGDDMYKSFCPACQCGLLLVGRDQKTLYLKEYDRCTLCGQQVKYTDIEDLRRREGHY